MSAVIIVCLQFVNLYSYFVFYFSACEPGIKGEECELCFNCVYKDGEDSCDDNGYCYHGCVVGWKGDKCDVHDDEGIVKPCPILLLSCKSLSNPLLIV